MPFENILVVIFTQISLFSIYIYIYIYIREGYFGKYIFYLSPLSTGDILGL